MMADRPVSGGRRQDRAREAVRIIGPQVLRRDERQAIRAKRDRDLRAEAVLASDLDRVADQLARRQERELRAWLYGAVPRGERTTLHAEIEKMTTEIESDHDVRVELVRIDQAFLDDVGLHRHQPALVIRSGLPLEREIGSVCRGIAVKVAEGRTLGDPETVHYGLIPRTNRGIFAINELPDLAGKIQVGLFNILQEGDVQIKGYPVRLPLDALRARLPPWPATADCESESHPCRACFTTGARRHFHRLLTCVTARGVSTRR